MIKKLMYKEYELHAQRVINHFFTEPTSVPIDIEMVINRLKIDIIPFKNLRNDFGAKGMIVRNPSGGTDIVIDEDHWFSDDFYFQFTLAEELAHLIVHADLYKDAKSVGDVVRIQQKMSLDEYSMIEQQARNIASYILFPRVSITKYLLDWVEQNHGHKALYRLKTKKELSDYIIQDISPKLVTSAQVLSLTLLKRYPEPLLIDLVIQHLGLEIS